MLNRVTLVQEDKTEHAEQNIHEQRIDHKPIKLTIQQACEGDPEFMEEGIFEVVLLSEFDDRICSLSTGCTFEGAHEELTNHIAFFKERGCTVEVVAC
jgi:hypothetical protein